MSRKRRRVWFAVAIVTLIVVAVAAHFLGDGTAELARQMHGPR